MRGHDVREAVGVQHHTRRWKFFQCRHKVTLEQLLHQFKSALNVAPHQTDPGRRRQLARSHGRIRAALWLRDLHNQLSATGLSVLPECGQGGRAPPGCQRTLQTRNGWWLCPHSFSNLSLSETCLVPCLQKLVEEIWDFLMNECDIMIRRRIRMQKKTRAIPSATGKLPVKMSGSTPVTGSFLKQFRVRACPDEGDDIAVQPVDQQEIATDVAFAVVGPIALGRVIQPLCSQRQVVGNQQQHRLFKAVQVVTARMGESNPVLEEGLGIVVSPGRRDVDWSMFWSIFMGVCDEYRGRVIRG